MYSIYEQLCKERNLTNYQIYKATGVSQSSLSEWKKGNSVPKYENMKKIAEFLEVSVDYLLGEEANKKSSTENGEAPKYSKMTIEILEMLDNLSEDKRKLALDFLEVLSNNNKK